MKLALVGEAWGAEEARTRMPFQGASGWLLNKLLDGAGIRRADCLVTNVFNLRPEPNNDISNLCGPKGESDLPPISSGKYIRRQYNEEIARLAVEVADYGPNLVVALGSTALWAFTGVGSISKNRGAVLRSNGNVHNGLSGFKLLPTYHPAAILRDYSLLPVTYADFAKASRERAFPEIRRPERQVYIEPELKDCAWFYEQCAKAKRLSIDIETRGDAITCIGFAPTISEAYVIPFEDMRKPGHSYWPNARDERMALEWVKRICALPMPKVFQNGLYDLHFLWRRYGVIVTNAGEDTMLLHHALQPEAPKGLAYMGSIYTNEASWKLMRGKTDTIKREDN